MTLLTGILLSLSLAPALAQDSGASNSSFTCGVDFVYPGASRDLLFRAAGDNANLYGAVGVAERELLPRLHENEGLKIFMLEMHSLAGALYVPARSAGDCANTDLWAPVDLTSGNWALAWSNDDVALFYNASVTTAQAHGSGSNRALMDGLVGPGVVIGYGLVAPFFPAGGKDSTSGSVSWDYIAGGELTPATFALSAGYVGSRGAYVHVSESRSGAFFGGAANQAFAELPYLRGGLERLQIPKLAEKVGKSSLYGRRFLLPKGSGTAATESADPPSELLTTHVAQEDIAGWVDLWAAYAARPTAFLHDLRIGVHTKDFSSFSTDSEGHRLRGVLGFVTMPADASLDVEGGRRFSGSVEYLYRFDDFGGYNQIELSARYNDPEILALFPYAEDALDVYFLLSFGVP